MTKTNKNLQKKPNIQKKIKWKLEIERMKNLNINFADIKESDLTKKIPSASNYIKNYDQLDELLFKFII